MLARDFRYFLAIVELNHFGRAAASLGISQPALSKGLQRLEEILGIALLERSRNGVTVTPAGQLLAERARGIVRDIDITIDDVQQLAGRTRGVIRVGTVSTIREHILPAAISRFASDHPDIQVVAVSNWSRPLLTLLDAGDIDVIVSGLTAPLKNSHYMCRPLLNDSVGISCRNGHPIFSQPITFSAIGRYNWALTNAHSPIRQWLEERMGSLRMQQPLASLETDSLSLIRNVVLRSDLLGFLPHPIAHPLIRTGVLRWVPIQKLVWQRTIYSIIRSDRRTSHLIYLFLKYLKHSIKSNAPVEN